jgi:hypothetical protein
MDPLLENRLLDRATLAELAANSDRAAPPVRQPVTAGTVPRLAQAGTLLAVNQYRDVYALEPRLPLAPGVRHALRIEFMPGTGIGELPGMLQVVEHGLFRQYVLPNSGAGVITGGAPRGFGALPSSGHVIPLESGSNQLADFGLIFIGSNSIDYKTPPASRFTFARYWLYSYTAKDLPVVIDSWMPYRARTEVAQPAWLETPRMWLRGYHALVNGRDVEVTRSPNNLVMIPLESGASSVTLRYSAPWWLAAAFWLSLSSWMAVLAVAVRRVIAQSRVFAAAGANAASLPGSPAQRA